MVNELERFTGIRKVWHNDDWWFAVVDIVAALTESPSPAPYWRMLKKKLVDEGSESVRSLYGLKMPAADGKMRLTDTADIETMLRIVQSIPTRWRAS
jgi:DNA-damage-inducible protein D